MPKSTCFRRILGLVILVAAIATLAVVVRYFIDNARKDKQARSRSFSTDLSMKSIHFSESSQHEKKWELFAQRGIYDKTNEKTVLDNIRFIVERAPKSGPVTVTADHGEYLHTPKTVQLDGKVTATTDDGMTFETVRITYDSPGQTFTTRERVRLTDAALTVEGVGMDLFVDRQQAVIRNQVEATVYPGKRKQ